jgi:hypothetical protein
VVTHRHEVAAARDAGLALMLFGALVLLLIPFQRRVLMHRVAAGPVS